MTIRRSLRDAPLVLVVLMAALALTVASGDAGAREATDTTAPNTHVKRSPGSPTNKTTADFAFSSTEPGDARFECSLDRASFRPCENPSSHADLAEGRHHLKVRSIDAAGNVDASPASRSWTVDLTLPQTLLTVEEGKTAARFEFSADEPVHGFYCSLDGAPPSRCAGPREYAGLPVGKHDFEVYGRDGAGNNDPTPEAASWTVAGDRAPAVTVEGAPRIESYYEYHYFEFAADVPDSSLFCSLDEEPFAPCTSGAYRYVPFGHHTFRVYAVSPGGVRGDTVVVAYESRDPNWD